jgi:uncharacterized protein YbjT (DUF2867 family)
MNSSLPVAVIGATGAQGGPVVEALLRAGRPVRALARSAASLAPLAARGAQVHPVDLSDADGLTRAFEGVSGAFLHLPFVPVEPLVRAQAEALVTALRAAAVPLAVFTLSGPAASSPTGVASFDTKAVAKQVLTRAELPLIGFEPLGYLGNLSAPFSAPHVLQDGELRYPLPAEHRQPWVSTEDQAALAVAALDRPDLAGRWFAVGELLTGPELAVGIGEGLGREVRYVPLEPADWARSLVPLMGPELSHAVADDYALLGRPPQALELAPDTATVRRELGVPATPVAQWAAAQDWQGSAAIMAAVTAAAVASR